MKTIKTYLRQLLKLEKTQLITLKGMEKLNQDEKGLVVELGATLSNMLGEIEMAGLLEKLGINQED